MKIKFSCGKQITMFTKLEDIWYIFPSIIWKIEDYTDMERYTLALVFIRYYIGVEFLFTKIVIKPKIIKKTEYIFLGRTRVRNVASKLGNVEKKGNIF